MSTEINKEAKITFDGKEYVVGDLSERGQYLVAQLNILQEEATELQAALDRQKVCMDGFSSMLKQELEIEKEEGA